MKLPAELRLMIYEFAIHDNMAITMIKTMAAGYKRNHQLYRGALALIHTTSTIRKESRKAMLALASREWEVLRERHDALFTAFLQTWRDDKSMYRYIKAVTLSNTISMICFALDAEFITHYRIRRPTIRVDPHSERQRYLEGVAFQPRQH
jgi:hypothetical protein